MPPRRMPTVLTNTTIHQLHTSMRIARSTLPQRVNIQFRSNGKDVANQDVGMPCMQRLCRQTRHVLQLRISQVVQTRCPQAILMWPMFRKAIIRQECSYGLTTKVVGSHQQKMSILQLPANIPWFSTGKMTAAVATILRRRLMTFPLPPLVRRRL